MATILTDIGLAVERFEKIESIRGGLAGVVVGEVLTLSLIHIFGHDDRPGEGTLVVIDNDLVDEGQFSDDRLLHSFGAVLLSVAGDQQALEAPQYVEESSSET